MKRLSVLSLLVLLLAACGDSPAPTADAFPVPSWAKVAPEQIAEAKKHGVPVAFENDIGMRFVLIPAGTFLVGSRDETHLRHGAEPQREVAVARPYYIQITEVTNAQYRAVVPGHRSSDHPDYDLDADDQPAVLVSWDEAVAYAAQVGCRLPTEVEWERAARGGRSGTVFPWGDEDRIRQRNGDGDEDGYEQAAPVASYPANDYGLYDVVGNVWEYCTDEVPVKVDGEGQDVGGFTMDGRDVTADEMRAELGVQRAIRGGSWMWPGQRLRCAGRSGTRQDSRNVAVGFRLVSPLSEKAE